MCTTYVSLVKLLCALENVSVMFESFHVLLHCVLVIMTLALYATILDVIATSGRHPVINSIGGPDIG